MDLNASGPKKRWRTRLLIAPSLLTLFILALHAIPGSDLPAEDWMSLFHVDKWIHLGMFASLSCAWLIAFGKMGMVRRGRVWVGVGCLIYSVLLEAGQTTLFTDRHADLLDIVADLAGTAAGWAVFRLIYGCWQ